METNNARRYEAARDDRISNVAEVFARSSNDPVKSAALRS